MKHKNVGGTAKAVPPEPGGAGEGTALKRRGGREAMELFFHILFLLCGVVAVAFVLFISIYLIISGLPAIREIGL
ncbi:MAG: phosphate ABC transporter permease subunit PstC, partial [Oscillospiraceae bacterium]